MAGALERIDSSVQKINNDLNTISGGIGDIFGDEAGYAASQVVELTTALGGFATAASQFAQGDFLGGIASVVSSVGSIFSMGKKVKEMNREAREPPWAGAAPRLIPEDVTDPPGYGVQVVVDLLCRVKCRFHILQG